MPFCLCLFGLPGLCILLQGLHRAAMPPRLFERPPSLSHNALFAFLGSYEPPGRPTSRIGCPPVCFLPRTLAVRRTQLSNRTCAVGQQNGGKLCKWLRAASWPRAALFAALVLLVSSAWVRAAGILAGWVSLVCVASCSVAY